MKMPYIVLVILILYDCFLVYIVRKCLMFPSLLLVQRSMVVTIKLLGACLKNKQYKVLILIFQAERKHSEMTYEIL